MAKKKANTSFSFGASASPFSSKAKKPKAPRKPRKPAGGGTPIGGRGDFTIPD